MRRIQRAPLFYVLGVFIIKDAQMYITLKEARRHLNLDDYFHEDDGYILSLIEACEDAVAKRLNRPLARCVRPETGELEGSVRQSVLLLIGTYYNQREATSPQQVREVPLAFDFLADLNQRYSL